MACHAHDNGKQMQNMPRKITNYIIRLEKFIIQTTFPIHIIDRLKLFRNLIIVRMHPYKGNNTN